MRSLFWLFSSLLATLGFLSASPLLAESPFASANTPSIPSQSTPKENSVQFTPPSGWHAADTATLPPCVKTMVVGKGPSTFPPSMNLSLAPYDGTLAQYLKIVKMKNSEQGYTWKDLGKIRTAAGDANLSQVDTKTPWGEVRLMHVILVRNGYVYILTASALSSEFQIFYKEFFASMRSLSIIDEAL